MDDNDIIELYFNRNERAILETSNKYGRNCYSISFSILNNPGDAEECVNDSYLNVWNAIPPTKPVIFSAFLYKITRNLSLKRLRHNLAQKRNHDITVSFSELEAVLPDAQVSFTESIHMNLNTLISNFLRTEKPDARNVFIRKYWFFDSIKEISSRYGILCGMSYHNNYFFGDY